MGTTEACLKQAGTCPMHRDSLKSKVTEEARWCAQVLSRRGAMFSDPVALLELMDSSSRCYGHSADCNKRPGLWGTKMDRTRFAIECTCD